MGKKNSGQHKNPPAAGEEQTNEQPSNPPAAGEEQTNEQPSNPPAAGNTDQTAEQLKADAAVAGAEEQTKPLPRDPLAHDPLVDKGNPMSIPERIEAIDAEIERIGDPYAARRKMGEERGALVEARKKVHEECTKAIGAKEQEMNDRQAIEDQEVNLLVALKAKREKLQAELDGPLEAQAA